MDLASFLKEIGGGLAGVVIVVQGWFNWIQYQRNNQLQDKILAISEARVNDGFEILKETNKTTNASTEIMRRAVQLLEDKR